MNFFEPVDLGENWVAVKRPNHLPEKWGGGSNLTVSHRCDPGLAVINPIQKNTHRRHGVRWRCKHCKAIVPKRVIAFMKLHKLHEKVRGNDS